MEPEASKRNRNLEIRLSELEDRIARLEGMLESSGFDSTTRPDFRDQVPAESAPDSRPRASFESRIGEYGMAWLGNIVLLLGILFLTQFLRSLDREILALVMGFVLVSGVYLTGYLTRTGYPHLSRVFTFNGHILLYLVAMQLYLFPGATIIDNAWIGHLPVLMVLTGLTFLADRSRSQVLAVVTWVMAAIAAIASGYTHVMLPVASAVAGTAILFTLRHNWWQGLIISVFLVYAIFLVWITGDPFITGSVKIIGEHTYGHIYLFACAMAYSFLALMPRDHKVLPGFMNAVIILNGLGFSFILTLVVLSLLNENYPAYFGLITAFCLSFAIILQIRRQWKNIASYYAIYSFLALSITIAGVYGFPLAFFLLAIQSLLVVSIALWFRSRFIVVMNFIMFAGLLVTYLIASESIHSVNFSFALVAMATARVINWKKKRLEIRTEFIRNVYLFTGFVMVLFSLHEAMPPRFVTLSWILSAIVFFVLSIVIPNRKYRWLSITTVVVTVFYLFLVDLNNISLGYRILALLGISVISLGISIFYARSQKLKE